MSEIRSDGVTVSAKDGMKFAISADSVILSVGYRPNPIASKGRHLHIVGDAGKVGNLCTYTTARYYTDDEILAQITRGKQEV